ncbi:hypothetical protein EJ07DRAFT_92710, partial [Lizonia empirigonia]
LSRISTTINSSAEIVLSGSKQDNWYRAQHLANNTFGPTDEETYSSSPGDGGTKCYVEGDEVKVVVVKIKDRRIADWKGQVRDWAVDSNPSVGTTNST